MNDPDVKTCTNPACRREYRRLASGNCRENRADFAARKYCSAGCSRAARAAKGAADSPKICEACGESFEWRPGMSSKSWSTRRYCGRVCAGSVPKNPPTHPEYADTGDSKWREQAVCAGRAPLFDPSDLWSDSIAAQMQTTALAFCGRCPALTGCSAEADSMRLVGLWGGVYRQRRHGRYWWQVFVPGAQEPQLRDGRRTA